MEMTVEELEAAKADNPSAPKSPSKVLRARACKCVQVRAYMCACMYVRAYVRVYTASPGDLLVTPTDFTPTDFTRAYIRTHARTHTHTHARAHTHPPRPRRSETVAGRQL